MFVKEIAPPQVTPAKAVKALLYTVVFNSALALLLAASGLGESFLKVFFFTQCIGLTICTCVMTTTHLFKSKGLLIRALAHFSAIVTGAVLGVIIGANIVGISSTELPFTKRVFLQIIGGSVIIGAIVSYFFHNKEQLAKSIKMVQEERMKRLSSEKSALEANLKRLQAQVEPHFLFNTLSNIVSLMDTDLVRAKAMQLDLIRYLRTALGRTRNQETTLGQETDMIRAYLDIFKIRMGERLQYEIDVPGTLWNQPLPPMLIQPLVENALLHGLEPKIDGGRVALTAAVHDRRLHIAISDTGNGLATNHRPGVGLTNVKERLAQLYGDKGHLSISENQPTGVTVTIEVPLQAGSQPNDIANRS